MTYGDTNLVRLHMDDLTPKRIFGDSGIGELQKRKSAWHVAQLVDRAVTLNDDPVAYRELLWLLNAAEEQIRLLHLDSAEADLLQRIVDAVPLDGAPLSMAYTPMVDYAGYLERQGCLDDALHVLALATRTYDGALPPGRFVDSALHAARLNRELGRWDRAGLCYGMAEQLGNTFDDPVSALRGKLGHGAILRGQGCLRAAEAVTRAVVADARCLSLTKLSVMTLLDLSVILGDQARYAEGLAVDRAALRLSTNDDDRTRAVCNIGVSLSDLGRYAECRGSLEDALVSAPSMAARQHAQLELLKIDAKLGDRVAFERRRRALESVRDRMPVIVMADFDYKLGIGFRRFGQRARALYALRQAHELTARVGLGHWCRRIERELNVHHKFLV